MPGGNFLRNLIQYVVFEVQDRDMPLLATRLVKLHYLIDVEHYRALRRRLTDLEWLRYKFGPFAWGLREAARGLGFDLSEERVDLGSRTGIRFRAEEPRDVEKWLPFIAQGIVNRVIRRWADEDLGILLDYVYLETEPMKGTRFGEALDFTTIDPSRRQRLPEEPVETGRDVKALRDRLRSYTPLATERKLIKRDEDLERALRGMDEAPDLSGLEGRILPAEGDALADWEDRE